MKSALYVYEISSRVRRRYRLIVPPIPRRRLLTSRLPERGIAPSERGWVEPKAESIKILNPRSKASIRATQTRHTSAPIRSEEHTSELQSLMRISYAVFCVNKKTKY